MRWMRLFFGLCMAAGATFGVMRQAGHPRSSQNREDAESTKRADPRTHAIRVNDMVVTLEMTTLGMISRRFGGTIRRSAHDHVWDLCLRQRGERRPLYIVFEASELGGDTHDVTGFRISTAAPPGEPCTGAPLDSRRVVTDTGLYLEMPEAEFRQRVHSLRFRRNGAHLLHEDSTLSQASVFDRESNTSRVESYYTYFGTRVQLRNQRLTDLYVWQVTSD
jgi:hypothetical protein